MKTVFTVTTGNGVNHSAKDFASENEARAYFNDEKGKLSSHHTPLREKYDTSNWSENDEALKESRLYRVELCKIDIEDDEAVMYDILEVTDDYELSDIE